MMGIQKVKTNRMRNVVTLLLCGVSLVFSQSAAYAATTKTVTPAPTGTANTLKVSPLRTDVTIKPGSSAKVSAFVTNLSKTAVVIKPIENDFVAGDEKGTPAIILDENSYSPTHSLKRFMQPIKNVTVAAGATQQIDVTISVPNNSQAGGYYGALRFAPATSDASKAVSLNGSVVSLILLTVPGPAVERLTMTNFDIQQNGGTATNFRKPDNLSLLLRFKNQGNLQEGPFGQIYVQKGKKVLYTYNFNQRQPKDQILPDSARRWDIPLKGFGKFGKYTVGATFTYGGKGQSIEITKTIWIIPSAIIAAIVIGIVVIAVIGLAMWAFLRNYKRRILKSSRRRY